ncbi:Hypothetical predicted protein [Olea europaea subsp. europaea]|uniref:DUF1985 domain-containing protein n=1 Tax=Olea europaea subsp. europaea TaxID=158383 RepID=A0A8S0PEM2_OLEEU|nr:Hypothetical predicted protein [Olea europaea subsp. europaea]
MYATVRQSAVICRHRYYGISIFGARECTVAGVYLATEQLELIQALVCRGIRCDKSHELWFNVRGHLTRFGPQEYAIVTGLHAGSFSEGDRYTKALEKRRLKEKYFKSLEKISCAQLEKAFLLASTPRADRYRLGLALIVEGVITALDNNVGIDEDMLAIVDDLKLFFAYPWAKVGYRHLLKGFRGTWARKMSDAKMKNEKDISYTIHEFSIVMQDVDTSASNGHHTPEGNGEDGSKPDGSGESDRDPFSETGSSDSENEVDASGRQSGALPTPVVAPSTSGVQGTRGGATLTREDVDGMLYDQRILFEMRLRTVKLEIMQHITEEFARLRDFIFTLVPPSSGTSTSATTPVVNEPNLWDDPHEDGQGSDIQNPHDDDYADDVEMQEGNAGEGSDKRSTHDDDHADEGEIHAVNDGEGGDEQSPEDYDRTEKGDMQDMNNLEETVPTLPSDDNEEGPSTYDIMEVDGVYFFPSII